MRFKRQSPSLKNTFNPLVHSAHKSARIAKISIPKLKGIIKKNSYEGCDYESVCPDLSFVPKNDEKRIQAVKG